jgi:small subunit ribosomal protein S1
MTTDQFPLQDEGSAAQQENSPSVPKTEEESPPSTPQADATVNPEQESVTPTEIDAATGEKANSPAAPLEIPPATAEASGTSGRKFQLRPTLANHNIQAVPSLGESMPAASGTPGPVAIPGADDADVQAALANAGSTASEPAAAPPPGPAMPVEIPQAEAIDASIEAAIEAAMAGEAAVGAASPGTDQPATGEAPAISAPVIDLESLQAGQKLQGTVQAVHEDSVFLDFDLRLTGVVPFRQFDAKKPPQVGDVLEVVFDRINDAEGLIQTNLPRGTTQVKGGDWSAVSVDQVVECLVTKTNKGGLEANVGQLRGFIPASQVELGYIADLQPYVGQKLRVRITEVKPAKRRLVLSRRALLEEERESAKAELLNEIKPDQTRTGRVKTIKEYGAFIDLGGMDGFLPIAQMSWVRIEHPSEVIQEGQQIEVKILSIDREKNRISLGLRQLAPNPWRTAETKYPKGSTSNGRVTRIEPFGAFVELEPGVEGLVHISELEHRRVKRVQEVLNVGDITEVQIIEVDPKKKRISLSVKALKAKPEPVEKPKDEDLAPGKGDRYERKRKEPLKGGTGSSGRTGLFGNPRDFGG